MMNGLLAIEELLKMAAASSYRIKGNSYISYQNTLLL